ncbi:MAG: glutamate racemase, partial [Moorella sp. (in: Bacteria)]|nr:glutamate racemase [Moorella sp. (in: firmicutes)]
VDACNTTSAIALTYLQKKYHVPIIGVIEPGVVEAVRATRNGRIGVIATEATVASDAHRKAICARTSGVEVFARACPKLVPLVEAGQVTGHEVEMAVTEYVEPLVKAGIDTLILGCTHYPFLAGVIQEVAGPGITLIDPAAATVRELKEALVAGNGLRAPHCSQAHSFFVSGDERAFSQVGIKLVGWPELVGTKKMKLE